MTWTAAESSRDRDREAAKSLSSNAALRKFQCAVWKNLESDVKMSTICAVNAVKGKHWTQPVNQRVPPHSPLVSLAALVPWERIKIYFAGISVCAENAFVELQLMLFLQLLQMH